MKFSSFLIFTAAGLAIAAPITPVTPSNLENKLTVEPVEVVKRGLPDTSALTGAVQGGLPTSGLPVGKRQSTLDPVVDAAHGKLPVPVKRGLPDTSALTGAVQGGLPTSGLPVGKRQLEGLIPSTSSKDDDSNETAEEPKIPKEPKEPKEPSQITDGTTEIDDGTEKSTSSAADALGGLPIGKRQLEGITEMLNPKPADPAEPADETAPAEGEETEEEPEASEEPAEGEDEADPPAEEEEPAEESALAGILKRQGLGDLTKGLIPESTPKDDAEPKDADADAAATEEDPDTTSKSQTSVVDDGTNGANSFDATPEEKAAAEKTAAETAPAKNATEPAPAKKEKASGLAGLLGI
jgi:hypothetical protein